MNAIELLKNDHVKVRGLLSELEATTNRASKKRADLLATIEREIEVHTAIEEEIFYPAYREAGDKEDNKMYFEALEEHRAAGDLVLPDLLSTDVGSDQFSGRAKVLKELIEHHAGEEEKEMFPRARKLLGAEQLRELGAAMEARKAELMADPAQLRKRKSSKGLLGAVVDAFSSDDEGDSERDPTMGPASGAASGRRSSGATRGQGSSRRN